MGSVCEQDACGEQEGEEPVVVSAPETVVHPYAAVVHPRYARLADTAVLTALTS